MPWKLLALVSQLLSYVIPTLMKQLVTGFEFNPELKNIIHDYFVEQYIVINGSSYLYKLESR